MGGPAAGRFRQDHPTFRTLIVLQSLQPRIECIEVVIHLFSDRCALRTNLRHNRIAAHTAHRAAVVPAIAHASSPSLSSASGLQMLGGIPTVP